MENQMSIGRQNTQQIGQNPVSQLIKSPEKHKANYLMILGIVLACFVVFGFGGYYLGRQSVMIEKYPKNLEKQQMSITPSQTDSPTATPPITDPTAEWKTYKNNKYGYSFKYPEPEKELAKYDTYTDDLIEINGLDSLIIRIEPIVTLETDPIKWWDGQKIEAYTNKATNCFSHQTTTVVKSLYDANKTVIDFDRDILLLNNFYSKENICLEPPEVQILLIQHKRKIVKITYDWAVMSEQILSTLKLID